MSKSISKPNFVEISQIKVETYFYGNPKWLGKGSIFFFKIKNVSISWDVLLHFMNTKKCIFDACRQRLHISGLICN